MLLIIWRKNQIYSQQIWASQCNVVDHITPTWTVIFEYFVKFLLIIYSSHDCVLSYIIKNYWAWKLKKKVSKMCLPQNTDLGMVWGDSKIFLLPNDFIQPYFQKLLIRANSQSLKFQVWTPSYDGPLGGFFDPPYGNF